VTSGLASERVCTKTGFNLVVADGELGWRIIKDIWAKKDGVSAETLNALSVAMHGEAGQLTLGDVCGEDRDLTTALAQLIRDSTLDDDTLPLGIFFASKTRYGRCWAWWNRRADDGLDPGSNDPTQLDSTNVHVSALDELIAEWNLKLIGSAS
jgi:hypothetical protein